MTKSMQRYKNPTMTKTIKTEGWIVHEHYQFVSQRWVRFKRQCFRNNVTKMPVLVDYPHNQWLWK